MDSIADNPVTLIDTLLQDTWLFVLRVKNDPSTFVSDAFRPQAITLVENVRAALTERSASERHIDTITYAQSALLDETVPTRLSPNQQTFGSATERHTQLRKTISWLAAPVAVAFSFAPKSKRVPRCGLIL